ncbi:MAG: ATP-binding cassette domain-containing protein, partial [Lachnospiraceae bacterium]|nr:ATP-binding cassette domain-containing protein [Lachnospiraceae bacterium]
KIGWVFSEELFQAGCSLKKNADVYGKYYPDYEPALLEKYCGQFGLKTERKLGKLSKGEKLKFQFAFALSHRPELLLLDEPTANFDPEFREEFLAVITDFISDGEHSVVLATHLTRDLDRLADYITMLNNGKLVFSLERSVLEDRYRIVSGEQYKLKLLPAERVLAMEKGAYGTKAFVVHSRRMVYDPELSVSVPTLEEIMYYSMVASKR